VKVGRTEKEAAVNHAISELKAAVSGPNCSIAVAQECMTLECKERSCAAKFLGKAIAELQKATQSVETSVQNLFTSVNKQLHANDEQISFLKKTACGLRETIDDLKAAEARSVVDQCIQRNGFYGHPENVLLSMVADDRPEIRELAVRRIKKARQAKSTNIRKFVLPKLNLDAEDYHSLVNWQECPITEPPLLMSKSDDDIESAITSRQMWTLDEFPCHSEAVERHIRIVSEAATSVCGELRRDGYIRAKLLSRTDIPHFGSKKDWK